MRSALKRIKKYKDKLTGFDGLEVVHTGYKHSRRISIRRYYLETPFFTECDRLARRLCDENDLDIVECARVFRFVRECCREFKGNLEYCYEALKECKSRFRDWSKCDEIAEGVKEINPLIGCYFTEANVMSSQFTLYPATYRVIRFGSLIASKTE